MDTLHSPLTTDQDSTAFWPKHIKNGETVFLPKGVHHLYPDDFPFRFLHISNNDDGVKHIVFDLSGLNDVILDGKGCELMIHGELIPFFMRDSKNITLKNITIDWAHPFCAQGRVVDVGPGWVEIQVEDEYQLEVREGHIEAKNPDLKYPVPIHNLNYIDPVREEQVYQSQDEYPMFMQGKYSAFSKSERTLRLESDSMLNSPEVGQIAVFHYDGRPSPVISVQKSEHIRLENLTFYHSGAIAAIFEGSRDLHLEKVEVRRRGNRWFSTLNDATHFVECSGNITLSNCHFEFQNDDATNIHGIFRTVDAALNAHTLRIRLMHFQQLGVDTIVKGNHVSLCDRDSLEILSTQKVAKVSIQDSQCTDIEFSEKLPQLDWQHVVVMKHETDVHVRIQGNTFQNNRARGILVTTLGKIQILDNHFHTPGPAIQIEYGISGKWFESGPVEDVEIRGNTFDQCNFGRWGTALFALGPSHGAVTSKNIRIQNNKIIQIYKPLVRVQGVDGFDFSTNTILQGTDYPHWQSHPNDLCIGENVRMIPEETTSDKKGE